jgi:uncharacterized small protein (DUF1192 family)
MENEEKLDEIEINVMPLTINKFGYVNYPIENTAQFSQTSTMVFYCQDTWLTKINFNTMECQHNPEIEDAASKSYKLFFDNLVLHGKKLNTRIFELETEVDRLKAEKEKELWMRAH